MNEPKHGLPGLLTKVVALVEQAGEQLLREWQREGGPRGRGDTAAVDSEIEQFLREGLGALLAADFWGEETGHRLTGHAFCWVVDPHDGTSDFLRGLPGSSISVALLHKQVPVLGVVHAPISPDRGSDCIAWAEGMPGLLRNGQPLPVNLADATLTSDSIVWLSAAASRKPEVNIELCAPARFIAMPSVAYRLARVAAGDGVCGVSLVGLAAHDVAGAHALLRGAGGTLIDQHGQPVDYRRGMAEVSLHCFGGAPQACRLLQAREWDRALRAPRHYERGAQVERNFPPVARMQRAAGCLAGLLAGDSLGGQVEFMTVDEIAEQCRHAPLRMADGGFWNLQAGQPTDDGELALALARALVADPAYDREALAKACIQWLASQPFDVGSTTRQGLSGPYRYPQLPVTEACALAANPDSQANGALMRVAPLGIAACGDPQRAARWARDNARLTHPHGVCLEANAAYAAAVAVAVDGGSRVDMLHAARAVLERTPEGSLTEPAAQVAAWIEAAVDGRLPDDYQYRMGWVRIALQNAFWHLAAGHSVEQAVLDTIRRGGDTDTNACIVGALIGAAEGIRALPVEWVLAVQSARAHHGRRSRPARYWPDDCLALAQRLLG